MAELRKMFSVNVSAVTPVMTSIASPQTALPAIIAAIRERYSALRHCQRLAP